MKNVTIEIRYVANGNNVLRRGTFPTKGKIFEAIALEWLKEIKREMPVDYLKEVIANGEDITDKVKELGS